MSRFLFWFLPCTWKISLSSGGKDRWIQSSIRYNAVLDIDLSWIISWPVLYLHALHFLHHLPSPLPLHPHPYPSTNRTFPPLTLPPWVLDACNEDRVVLRMDIYIPIYIYIYIFTYTYVFTHTHTHRYTHVHPPPSLGIYLNTNLLFFFFNYFLFLLSIRFCSFINRLFLIYIYCLFGMDVNGTNGFNQEITYANN